MNIVSFRRLHKQNNPVIQILTTKWNTAKGVNLVTQTNCAIVFSIVAVAFIIAAAGLYADRSAESPQGLSVPTVLAVLGSGFVIAAASCFYRFQQFADCMNVVESASQDDSTIIWNAAETYFIRASEKVCTYLTQATMAIGDVIEDEPNPRKKRELIEGLSERHQDFSALFDLPPFRHFEDML